MHAQHEHRRKNLELCTGQSNNGFCMGQVQLLVFIPCLEISIHAEALGRKKSRPDLAQKIKGLAQPMSAEKGKPRDRKREAKARSEPRK